jgi:hypothetical protein
MNFGGPGRGGNPAGDGSASSAPGLPAFRISSQEVGYARGEGIYCKGVTSGSSQSLGAGKRPNECVGVGDYLLCPRVQSSTSGSFIGCHHSSPAETSGSWLAMPKGKPGCRRAGTNSATGCPFRAITMVSPHSTNSWRRDSWDFASWTLNCVTQLSSYC